MAESRDAEPQQAAAEPLPEKVMAQLTEIAALLSLSAEQYKQQTRLTRQTANAELALSLRSVTLAAALMVAIGAGVVTLWGSLLALIGYLIWQATASLPLTAALLFLVQIAVLYWCVRNMRYLIKKVGFSHTIAQIKGIFRFTAAPAGGNSVNRSVD